MYIVETGLCVFLHIGYVYLSAIQVTDKKCLLEKYFGYRQVFFEQLTVLYENL